MPLCSIKSIFIGFLVATILILHEHKVKHHGIGFQQNSNRTPAIFLHLNQHCCVPYACVKMKPVKNKERSGYDLEVVGKIYKDQRGCTKGIARKARLRGRWGATRGVTGGKVMMCLVLTDRHAGRGATSLDGHGSRIGTVSDRRLRGGDGEHAAVRQLAGNRLRIAALRQSVLLHKLAVFTAAVVGRCVVVVVLRFDHQFVADGRHLKKTLHDSFNINFIE